MLYDDDPEIRPQIAVYTISWQGVKEPNSDRFKRVSKWSSLRRALANLIVKAKVFKSHRKAPTLDDNNVDSLRPPNQLPSHVKTTQLPRAPSAAELKQAEVIMIKTV